MSKKLNDGVVYTEASYDFYKPRSYVEPVVDYGPGLTRQEFAEECDVNEIMRRYEVTGTLPQVAGEPVYVDLTAQPDNLMDAMRVMRDAENAFMTLPARVRKEFENSPMEFVRFATDPANLDQMRQWGLAPAVELPDAVREQPQAAPAGAAAAQAAAPVEPAKPSVAKPA